MCGPKANLARARPSPSRCRASSPPGRRPDWSTRINNAPILLVEDNADDVLLTRRAFAKNNITNSIVVAGDGEEALAYLIPADGTAPLKPAMVLLDVKLPKLDGLEVLRRIRAHGACSSLPVIMLTTSDEQRDVIESYRLGANSFIRKPVAFSDFVEAARILGIYWLLLNESSPAEESQ
jgi:two-component system response regulator